MSSVITKSGTSEAIDYSKQPVVVDVKDVTMIFNMASESLTNLKEYFIKLVKHELFFEEFRALKNVSFTVHKGEVVGLVGTNGSGKSTILKIIAGVLEPSKGSVTVNGNIAPLIELGAGFDPELTARENIYLNGSLLGYTKEFIDANLDGIIEFAELHDFMDMPLKNFSSGMVARIAFAIATITDPDVLIVDETLSVGDVFFQEKCERRIQKFIQSGDVTVLFVSHSLEQVERICQRAVWIEKGNLRMDGPVNEVCAAYRDQFQFEFVDIDEHTSYREDIEWLVRKHITKGFAIDNTHREFRADETLKRQDFASFVYRLVGKPEFEIDDALVNAFDDVNESSPGAKGIWWMLKSNLISYDKTKPVHKFGGMDELSIADALTFFDSLQQFYGIDKSVDYGLGDRDVNGLAARSDVAHLLRCFYREVLSDL